MAWLTVDSNNTLGTMVEEAGAYNVKIVRAEVRTSGRNNKYVSIDYEVLDGKYKGGEIRYQNLTWSDEDPDNSFKRFNTLLVAIGVPDGTDIISIEQYAKGILGKKLMIDVDWAEPNNKGKIYLQVRGYRHTSPDGSQSNGVRRPDANAQPATTNTTKKPSSFGSKDPFNKSKNDSISITDDDLPF